MSSAHFTSFVDIEQVTVSWAQLREIDQGMPLYVIQRGLRRIFPWKNIPDTVRMKADILWGERNVAIVSQYPELIRDCLRQFLRPDHVMTAKDLSPMVVGENSKILVSLSGKEEWSQFSVWYAALAKPVSVVVLTSDTDVIIRPGWPNTDNWHIFQWPLLSVGEMSKLIEFEDCELARQREVFLVCARFTGGHPLLTLLFLERFVASVKVWDLAWWNRDAGKDHRQKLAVEDFWSNFLMYETEHLSRFYTDFVGRLRVLVCETERAFLLHQRIWCQQSPIQLNVGMSRLVLEELVCPDDQEGVDTWTYPGFLRDRILSCEGELQEPMGYETDDS